jgi:hypothetical protein
MRVAARSTATLVVLVGLALAASAAGAAAATLQLRIEGRTQTLFEGPIASSGHQIQASSDTAPRRCDGVNPNRPENTLPGPTPTAAAVDAMMLLGETFDGRWYAGLDDYLITRWGPLSTAEGESWFLLVNSVLSNVGGCQLELHEGAEVLWAYLVSPAKLLALYPAGASPGAPALTATAQLGVPFTLEVASHGVKEGAPPPAPESAGYAPYAGALIAPVSTTAQGFETVEASSPEAVHTNAEGRAAVTFTQPGWHRLKASAAGFGVIRSNRLDVCVPAAGAGDCGAPPAEDSLRGAPGAAGASTPAGGGGGVGSGNGGPAPVAAVPGAGGHSGGARLVRIDGLVLAPLGPRSAALHYRGRWRIVADRRAWDRLVAIGGAGAAIDVRLPRGRPAFIVAHAHRGTRVRIVAAGYSRTLRVPTGNAPRLLLTPARARGGMVRLRVLAGALGVEGVAAVR